MLSESILQRWYEIIDLIMIMICMKYLPFFQTSKLFNMMEVPFKISSSHFNIDIKCFLLFEDSTKNSNKRLSVY